MPKKSSRRNTRSDAPDFSVVVVGASAGGFNAIFDLVKSIPSDIYAAFLIVLHHPSPSGITNIIEHVQRYTKLTCNLAEDNAVIKANNIYFAVPGLHMLVEKKNIILGMGPEENRFKPSIDAMFRTAAVEYKTRVISVILSGLLDDGVSGSLAVMKCGGTTIVQDPSDAEFPDLPLAVLRKIKPDHVASASKMGNLIQD